MACRGEIGRQLRTLRCAVAKRNMSGVLCTNKDQSRFTVRCLEKVFAQSACVFFLLFIISQFATENIQMLLGLSANALNEVQYSTEKRGENGTLQSIDDGKRTHTRTAKNVSHFNANLLLNCVVTLSP